jgi:hypothetical protein
LNASLLHQSRRFCESATNTNQKCPVCLFSGSIFA